jgi:hypothetical protein
VAGIAWDDRALISVDAGSRNRLSRCRLRSERPRGQQSTYHRQAEQQKIFISHVICFPLVARDQSLLGRKHRLGNCHMHAVISIDHLGYF